MKRLIILLVPILLCGCTNDFNRKEINDLDLVLVIGIDYHNGEYIVSALYNSVGGASSAGGGSSSGTSSGQEKLAQGNGKTVYQALENLVQKNKKAISLAQTGEFLIGEEAAKQDINESLDFLSRDETIKMEALVYIIKGKKASDFINYGIKNKQMVHEDLDAIKLKQQEFLTRNDNTVVNILNDMEQPLSNLLIPYLIADKSGFLMNGYAVFDHMKLKDYLDKETSDGVNFVRDIIRSYPIYLKDKLGLMISDSNTKVKTKFQNNAITVRIKVNFETTVKEVLLKGDIFHQSELNKLTDDQNHYIKKIIEKAVGYSKMTGLDIFNLSNYLDNMKDRTQREEFEKNWSQMITTAKYQYEIQSKISRSFILGKKEDNDYDLCFWSNCNLYLD